MPNPDTNINDISNSELVWPIDTKMARIIAGGYIPPLPQLKAMDAAVYDELQRLSDRVGSFPLTLDELYLMLITCSGAMAFKDYAVDGNELLLRREFVKTSIANALRRWVEQQS